MKPYCLMIIKDQKIRMEYYFEYRPALQRAYNLLKEYGDEECEFIVYRTEDKEICFTFRQREEGEE